MGERDWIALLPIRQWSEFDIWLYILSEDIEINDKYRYGYDRVGCGIACPNYTKYTWVLDKYWYPYLFNRWRNILRNDFMKEFGWSKSQWDEKVNEFKEQGCQLF